MAACEDPTGRPEVDFLPGGWNRMEPLCGRGMALAGAGLRTRVALPTALERAAQRSVHCR